MIKIIPKLHKYSARVKLLTFDSYNDEARVVEVYDKNFDKENYHNYCDDYIEVPKLFDLHLHIKNNDINNIGVCEFQVYTNKIIAFLEKEKDIAMENKIIIDNMNSAIYKYTSFINIKKNKDTEYVIRCMEYFEPMRVLIKKNNKISEFLFEEDKIPTIYD